MPWESEPEPCFVYYKYLIEFFKRVDYSKLHTIRNFGLVKNGGFVMANDDESLAIIYVPKENYGITLNDRQLIGLQGQYTFFNTITGEYTEPKSFIVDTHQNFRSCFKEDDSILIIELQKGK